VKRFWLAVLLALLLAACTGTSSVQAPRLLIATFGSGSQSRVALVLDNGPQQPGAPLDRLEFLVDSLRPLAGQAVALDFVDRAGARNELVLLLHEGASQYSLAFLNTAGIDPAAPAAFEPSRQPFPLNAALASLTDPASLCLTDVQVTHDGRFAVLLNGGSAAVGPACPDSVTAAPELFLVDLTGVSPVASINPTADLLAVRPFLDQAVRATGDQLFYLVGAIQSAAELRSVALPPPAGSPDGILVGMFGSGNTYPLDLAARGREEGMLALRSSSIELLLPDGRNVPAATPATPVRFIRDPYVNELRQVLVLRSGGYSVHRDPADAKPVTGTISGVTGATVDPDRDYAYFLSAGAITVLDILDLGDSADPDASGRDPSRFRVPELASPAGLIDWIPAAVPAPVP
jgi:hypothetical protein